LIDLSHIEKTYDSSAGPVHALKDISLHIDKGEIFGIIGLSGAGKSTLVRCINLLERPTKGKVSVNGKDMTAMSESQLREARKNIGMIFSISICFPRLRFSTILPFPFSCPIRPRIKSKLGLQSCWSWLDLPTRRSNFHLSFPADKSNGWV